MKTRALSIAPLAAALLLAFNASAQDHSQHSMPTTEPDHSQHHKPATKADHSQHQQPASQEDHSQHQQPPVDHAAMGHAMPPTADQPVTPIPPLTDADRAAAQAPPNDHPVHDNGIFNFVQFNRLEAFDADDGRGLEWEGQAWIGRDRNKLWLRSEGERVDGHTESADLEALYGRAITPWWDVVAGVRHDFKPGASQDFAAIGVMGLAPYKFEVEATAYVGQGGQTAARLEAEYETLLTNRLIMQPLVEVNAYGQNDARRSIGSGLSSAEAGLRLRYEITRQFAPYIGVVREWSFGRTADFRREEGETVNDTRIVAGVRIWF
ncbi:copper resistance protein B [Lysobacter terrae]